MYSFDSLNLRKISDCQSFSDFNAFTGCRSFNLECLYDQIWSNSRYRFLYIFVHNFLANFNLWWTLEFIFLDLYFPKFTAAINFHCSKSCENNWIDKITSFSQKYHTGWSYNNNLNSLRVIFYINFDYIFSPCVYLPWGGGYFRNFWVGMCRWDPGTLSLY